MEQISFLEDFSKWTMRELVEVPPESLEYADLVGLAIELQKQLDILNWMYEGLKK